MMDSLFLKAPGALKRTPINKRAEEKVLEAELSIKDIALLRYIDDRDKQKVLIGINARTTIYGVSDCIIYGR